jgi:hypothetical protein
MVKATKKSRSSKASTANTIKQAIDQALRVAYEVDRYEWLCGNKPMPMPPMVTPSTLPLPKPTHHQNNTLLPIDRAKRAICKFYPGGADEVSTAAVKRKLNVELADENKQLGVKALSYDTVARALGRR